MTESGPNKSIKPTSTPPLRSGAAAAYARRWASMKRAEEFSLHPKAVLFVAARTSALHISWLLLVIGGPMMYFNNTLVLTWKVAVVATLFLAIWACYFLLSWAFHRRSLRKEENLAAYQALSAKEHGNQLGSWLEGW